MPAPMNKLPNVTGAPLPTNPLPANSAPEEEPILPEAPEPSPLEEPMPEAAPIKENTSRLAELANQLYDSATKMQRDADALRKELESEKSEPELPTESMSPEESDAASKALIGL